MTYGFSDNGKSVAVVVNESFSDYGPQPVPTVPSPDETTNLLSLMHNSSGSGSSLSG
jgi:hypothetical protein